MAISNATHISKDSKLTSTYTRKHAMFVFLDLGYFTQDDYFQFHPLPNSKHVLIAEL